MISAIGASCNKEIILVENIIDPNNATLNGAAHDVRVYINFVVGVKNDE